MYLDAENVWDKIVRYQWGNFLQNGTVIPSEVEGSAVSTRPGAPFIRDFRMSGRKNAGVASFLPHNENHVVWGTRGSIQSEKPQVSNVARPGAPGLTPTQTDNRQPATALLQPKFFPPLRHSRLRCLIHPNLIRPRPCESLGRPLASGVYAHLRAEVGETGGVIE
jgi:hypothetical protein